ncbi:hypothetical protein [Endozoicomonas ascidiicola]|uniref:hypothetical protein n=1 Tax=Endozoicomonas ascidiicola TaxID=1698521 RepID=UPI000A58DEA9|nr:hypothetical protein [Endozoicomonas ascidiicola]
MIEFVQGQLLHCRLLLVFKPSGSNWFAAFWFSAVLNNVLNLEQKTKRFSLSESFLHCRLLVVFKPSGSNWVSAFLFSAVFSNVLNLEQKPASSHLLQVVSLRVWCKKQRLFWLPQLTIKSCSCYAPDANGAAHFGVMRNSGHGE